MKNKIKIILLSLFFLNSCTKYIHDYSNLVVEDDKYDTEFPHRNCSRELSNINKSTRMITCVGYYNEYHFDLNDKITLQNMNIDNAVKTTNYNNTSTGTSTIISNKNKYVVMITCAHVVNTSEKIVNYYSEPNETIISSVAFLKRKMIFCSDLATEKIEVLISDDKIDMALIGAITEQDENMLPVLNYPVGKSKDLEWGSFVYMFGYPRGYKMISHGIVSLSKPQMKKYFYVDAPFNRGFSGGLVMAIRDGVPNFEFVGIATSAAAEFYNYLSSSLNTNFYGEDYNFDPYKGDIYIKKLEMIMYGVTQITSIDAIRELIEKNKDYLKSNGYFIDKLFSN